MPRCSCYNPFSKNHSKQNAKLPIFVFCFSFHSEHKIQSNLIANKFQGFKSKDVEKILKIAKNKNQKVAKKNKTPPYIPFIFFFIINMRNAARDISTQVPHLVTVTEKRD
jgi:hypothetical protein